MHENAQELPRTPAAAGITDGVVELRKRRPAAPAPCADRTAPGGLPRPAPEPAPDAGPAARGEVPHPPFARSRGPRP
ncbi:hypothetical protein BX286_6102 [Streptomyces sp. 3211.6]|uniref:hypothetical protein n=1 Tax=Streptomyces TaxID=1883 RepID=UPI000C2C9F9D|nr:MULTISPECIES: hypothetical protein [Streptomyces]RKT08023.1 hypothetical protein BX286_6102 [Streptomyces sp. 3211.6]RPF44358.1 hypothetical protein EDD96_0881 [Streptomyces sp. Ag109_G2-6]